MNSHMVRFPTSSKYKNVKVEHEGIRFDSKKERARYLQLRLLESNGEVKDIELQVSYPIPVGGKVVCRYVADFRYKELRKGTWIQVVEDVKGVRTAMYNLKKKLMRHALGIEIRES